MVVFVPLVDHPVAVAGTRRQGQSAIRDNKMDRVRRASGAEIQEKDGNLQNGIEKE